MACLEDHGRCLLFIATFFVLFMGIIDVLLYSDDIERFEFNEYPLTIYFIVLSYGMLIFRVLGVSWFTQMLHFLIVVGASGGLLYELAKSKAKEALIFLGAQIGFVFLTSFHLVCFRPGRTYSEKACRAGVHALFGLTASFNVFLITCFVYKKDIRIGSNIMEMFYMLLFLFLILTPSCQDPGQISMVAEAERLYIEEYWATHPEEDSRDSRDSRDSLYEPEEDDVYKRIQSLGEDPRRRSTGEYHERGRSSLEEYNERRKPIEGDYDRRRYIEGDHDRRKSIEDNYEKRKYIEDERRKSMERDHERRNPIEGDYERRKSMERDHERRNPIEGDHERRRISIEGDRERRRRSIEMQQAKRQSIEKGNLPETSKPKKKKKKLATTTEENTPRRKATAKALPGSTAAQSLRTPRSSPNRGTSKVKRDK